MPSPKEDSACALTSCLLKGSEMAPECADGRLCSRGHSFLKAMCPAGHVVSNDDQKLGASFIHKGSFRRHPRPSVHFRQIRDQSVTTVPLEPQKGGSADPSLRSG